MRFHFRSKKKERINLSELLLKKESAPGSASEAVRSKDAPVTGARIAGKRKPGALLTVLLLAGTTTIAAFVVVQSNKSPRTAAVTNAGQPAIRDWERKLEGGSGNELKGPEKEYNSVESRLKEPRKLSQRSPRPAPVLTSSSTAGNRSPVPEDAGVVITQYRVLSRASVFYEPDEGSRKGVIVWKKGYHTFNALSEQNGFVYAVVTKEKHQTIEGWLRKSDLQPVNVYFHEGDLK